MKQYKLVKEYPGSIKLGTIVYLETEDNYMTNIENDFKLFPKKIVENYPEFWELVIEKDYEILSLIEGKIIYPCDKYSKDYINQLFNTLGVSIHSVKRLSDGEIFTIGDKLNNSYISSILLYQNIIWLMCQGNSMNSKLNDAVKIKQPLFTTEDGVDIFDGDEFWFVNNIKNGLYLLNHTVAKKGNNKSKKVETILDFSTKEKAEKYIIMNKPCLSLNDLKPWGDILVSNLEKLVQQKK